jgi:hypothetical protein
VLERQSEGGGFGAAVFGVRLVQHQLETAAAAQHFVPSWFCRMKLMSCQSCPGLAAGMDAAFARYFADYP